MKVFVGTSGWAYFWNPDGLDWYLRNSGLNAVELNASFYRFPYPNQVKSWARKTRETGIRWSVKVHRSITHRRLLSSSSYGIWDRFRERFNDLDPYIDFYLVQLPPRAKPSKEMVERVKSFANHVELGWRLALEFRSPEWFRKDWVDFLRTLGVTYVSVDSPEARFTARSGPYTYLRLHGRTGWYSHYYTNEELKEIATRLINLGGESIYVFFNNDHGMLENAVTMKGVLEGLQYRRQTS